MSFNGALFSSISLYWVLSCIIVPLMALFILGFLLITNPLVTKEQTRLFMAAAIICFVAILAVSADAFFESYKSSYSFLIRRVTSFLGFSLSPTVPFLFYSIFHSSNKKRLMLIPIIINAICCFLSIFFELVFYINIKNSYSRGVLFFLPFVTAGFYLVMMFVGNSKVNSKSKKHERLFLLISLVFLSVIVYLEMVHYFKFLMWGFAAIATSAYYSLLNVIQYNVDSLTGVYNRQMYNKTLGQIVGSNKVIIANLDINYLKKVNDEQGHKAGDALLCSFSRLINKYLSRFADFYRVGGDEFVLISKKLAFKEMVILLEETQKIAITKDISFAFGVAEYSKNDNLEDVLQLADKLMYENKRIIKAAASKTTDLVEDAKKLFKN